MNQQPQDTSFDKLVDLVEGRLPAEEQAALRALVATQPEAATDLAWLERLIILMRDDTLEDAPSHVINRAVRLMRPKPAPSQPGLLERIAAVLQFDSLQTPVAVGVRSGQAGMRQMLYNAKGRDLDLRITPSGSQWVIAGQVLGPDEGGQVEVLGADKVTVTDMNDLSEFTLPPLPAGTYTLILRQGSVEVEVAGLELGVSSSKSEGHLPSS